MVILVTGGDFTLWLSCIGKDLCLQPAQHACFLCLCGLCCSVYMDVTIPQRLYRKQFSLQCSEIFAETIFGVVLCFVKRHRIVFFFSFSLKATKLDS